jgi:GntR family transcriptional regulator
MTPVPEVTQRVGAAYLRVADDLRAAIADGTYQPGAQLPSESELMRRYGIARGTVRQTYAQLQAEGLVTTRQGSRRTVAEGAPPQSLERMVSFSEWVRSLGETPSGRVVHLIRREATDEESGRLALPPGAAVFHLLRLRLVSGAPTMIERTLYPEALGRLLVDMDLEHDSITERMGELGHVFAHASHIVDAVAATAEDGRLLGIRPRSPLLRTRRLSTDPGGTPLEWSEDRYRGDAVALQMTNSVSGAGLSRIAVER